MNKKEIETIKKGELLFKTRDNDYYGYKNKYFSINNRGEYKKLEIEDIKKAISNELVYLDDETERVINAIRLNTLFIKELYDEKIKLLMLKII